MHDFASKQDSKNLKRKRTGNKRKNPSNPCPELRVFRACWALLTHLRVLPTTYACSALGCTDFLVLNKCIVFSLIFKYQALPCFEPYVLCKITQVQNLKEYGTYKTLATFFGEMRSSQVVRLRASGCQSQSHNSPGVDPSILRHSEI